MDYPRIYDTLTRSMMPLMPSDGKTFRFYCCGPTVYGPAHIGNFRTFILQDILRRVIEASGIPTRHVRNVTDVDDKTIRQAQAEHKTLQAFTEHWLARFRADAEALNLLPPHVEPGAVAHIPLQIRMIEQLIGNGHAYAADDGSVYFRVNSFSHYGKLSRLFEREITTQQCGCGAHDADEYDRESASDFALWKAHKPEDGENAWPSPWGPGRPGWHIECSAMSVEYLGPTFDLHGGGVDLVFPHHENEIAQSEASTGAPFARIWFHSAHLMVESQKMSKSLGNLYTLDDARARGFTPMELRYVLASGHYRQPLNFSWDSLHAARSALHRLSALDAHFVNVAGTGVITDTPDWGLFEPAFQALKENLNTPDALGKLFTAAKDIEGRLHRGEWKPEQAQQARSQFYKLLHALGLRLEQPQKTDDDIVPDHVKALAEKRWQAKAARDWAQADALRKQLTELGWVVRDAKDSYEITRH